jgi:NAD+ kinase
MRSQIAIFTGSFNPPGLHHRQIAEILTREFGSVIVAPCGPRPDKQTAADVESTHRAALVDIAFRGLDRLTVELFDLEQAVFSKAAELQMRYQDRGDLWHVVGSDLTEGGKNSAIHRTWEDGPRMWAERNFLVVSRAGHTAVPEDLPPHHRVISLDIPRDGDSAIIREKIFKREPFAHLVSAEVGAYIERYGLYRGRIPSRTTRMGLETPRLLFFLDERSRRSLEVAKSLERWVDYENPNCVAVVGGDGTMLRAIRKHWRRRLPFFGMNTGHLGFLLNSLSEQEDEPLGAKEVTLHQLPMLYVEMESEDGVRRDALAFNDAWIERATSQSLWMKVEVNGQTRLPNLAADGLLVSTAAGSTAYARSMGASPLLVDTASWLLVGSNVMRPPGWKSALLAMDASAEFTVEGGSKRPAVAYVDGQAFGEVTRMRVRMSRIATAELAFRAQHDMAEKIACVQFPS